MSTLNPPEHRWITVRVIDKRDWSSAEKHHAVHEDELGETVWELLSDACRVVGISTQAYHPTTITELSNFTVENEEHVVKIEVSDAYTHEEMIAKGLVEPTEEDKVSLSPTVWGNLWNEKAARELHDSLVEND